MLVYKDEILHQFEGSPFLEEARKEARESVPEHFRTMVRNLYDNPMGLYVCRSLYRTNINSEFDYKRAVKAAAKAPEYNLSELPKILEGMEAKDIITVEQRNGKPDYFLTPTSVEAMEIISTLEKRFVRPVARLFRNDVPELKDQPKEEVEKLARSLIYVSLA